MEEEIKKLKKSLEEIDEIVLENVEFTAEELTLIPSAEGYSPKMLKAYSLAKQLEQLLSPREKASIEKVEEVVALPVFEKLTFEKPLAKFTGTITPVTFGKTKKEGGSRSHTLTVGGETTMPFYRFETENPLKPLVALDVFDMKISLAKPVKKAFKEVLEDPAEWARWCVEKYDADMVTIHLISTDPFLKDTKAKEASKVVEEVLQAVKVPIIIGGSGNPDKDPEVLERAAEVSEGERCMINSASLNSDYKRVARACMEYGHIVLAFTSMDLNDQKTLNRYLFEMGIEKKDMLMDPTTAALGYGLEYSFTIMERVRLAGLKGDEDLQQPISSGTTNAWGAREAWMKNPEWGTRMKRGPLWEAVTALTLSLAGSDVFMMMNPLAVKLFKKMIDTLTSNEKSKIRARDWISM